MNLRISFSKWLAVFALAVPSLAATNELALGEVKIDALAKAISFPALVNMRTGAVEYLLVHEQGKVHESIFRTAVGAQKIHAAALLFSAKDTNGSPMLKVRDIEVSWSDAGKTNAARAPDLIFDKEHRRPLRETRWAYRGSRLIDGVFLAERDGSIIAIMYDRDALIEQDTPAAADDENWEPVTASLPPVGSEVTISLLFEKPK